MSNKDQLVINDSVKITDSVSFTSWLAPSLFLKEFKSYRDNYLQKEDNGDLVMAYVTLQLFLENHFHYYLRFLIGGGFSSIKVEKWEEKKRVTKKLDWFSDYLLSCHFKIDWDDFSKIKEYYQEITDIRNSFAHGHPVTETTSGNTRTSSRAKNYLDRQKFNDICNEANMISDLWNKIMCQLQEQDNTLKQSKLPAGHFFDNCKFKVF